MGIRLEHFTAFEKVGAGKYTYYKGIGDGCRGCCICGISFVGYLQASEVIKSLTGGTLNIWDFIHHAYEGEGPYALNEYFDPNKLINSEDILKHINRQVLKEVREKYYSLPESERPEIEVHWSNDEGMTQKERFEDRMKGVERAIELWEKGEYIGWAM